MINKLHCNDSVISYTFARIVPFFVVFLCRNLMIEMVLLYSLSSDRINLL